MRGGLCHLGKCWDLVRNHCLFPLSHLFLNISNKVLRSVVYLHPCIRGWLLPESYQKTFKWRSFFSFFSTTILLLPCLFLEFRCCEPKLKKKMFSFQFKRTWKSCSFIVDGWKFKLYRPLWKRRIKINLSYFTQKRYKENISMSVRK